MIVKRTRKGTLDELLKHSMLMRGRIQIRKKLRKRIKAVMNQELKDKNQKEGILNEK